MPHPIAQLASDLRHALRSLAAAPLFTVVAIVSMAFGIGASTAVFTLMDQVVLRALPVDRPGELVQVHARDTESYGGGMGDGSELSYAMYRDLRDRNAVFAGMFCRMPYQLQVGYGGRTEQVEGQLVSGTFFPVLGVEPALGRLFTADEDRNIGGHPYAVLSHAYWTARFGGDRAIVGRTIEVNRRTYEVVGVTDARFVGLDVGQPVQVYVPMTMQPQIGPTWLKIDGRRLRFVQVFARLRGGMTIERAQAGLAPLYRSLLDQEVREAAFASAAEDTKQAFLRGTLTVEEASRGHSNLRDSVVKPLIILLAVAGGVLLIVCANVANLLIARGAARQREIALRLALGAGRAQVARLLLVESLVLASAGATLGLLVATWGADLLLGFFVTPESPMAVTAVPDGRILAFAVALAVLTAVFAGLVPAFRSTRVDVAPALKAAGGGVVAEEPHLRKALVVAQVALSCLLLIGAGLFVRSLTKLLEVNPGFRTQRMLTFSFDLAASGYDADRARAFVRTWSDRVSRVPGVTSTGYAFIGLLGGGGWGMGFTIEGYTPPPGQDAGAMCNAVSPDFFRTMGMSLLAGREFDERDDRALKDGWPYTVAVVNETFAKRYFKGESPIGRHLGIGQDPGTKTPIEIVGLVRDAKYTGIRDDARAQVFFPLLQATIEGVTVYVRTSAEPEVMMPALRREMMHLDPQLAIFGVSTLDERVARSVVNERLIASLSATLSTVATLLSVIGLYGVVAYTVTRRTREIGIRMALGAPGSRIAAAVMREAGTLVLVGLTLGFGAAWWLGRYVEGQLYGVTPADTLSFALAGVTLATVAGVAAALPARRAARIAPMAALRGD